MHRHLVSLRFLKFALVGAFGTILHYVLLIAAVEVLTFSAVTGTMIGSVAGASFNYFFNRRYTFRSRSLHEIAMPRFALVALLGFVLNAVIVQVGTSLGVYYLVSQLFATGCVLVVGYSLNAAWTFGSRPPE